MKALCFEKAGEPSEVIELREIEKPEPGRGEARLRLIGSPINPADEMFIKGQYRLKPEFPEIAGLEGAGIIDAVGPNVSLPAGARASFFARRAWAEYVTVPAADLFILPDALPEEKAVQSFLNPVTSWGLLERAAAKQGEWILVSAGNSSVSKIVTQIASEKGINVILAVRRKEYFDELRSLGAEAVIDGSTENIRDRVLELTDGKGAEVVLDCVGGKTGTELLKSAAPDGRVVVFGSLSRDPVEIHNSLFLYRGIGIKGFSVRGYFGEKTPAQRKEMFDSLAGIIGRDDFRLDTSASYAFESYRAALKDYREGRKRGKVILRPR